LFNTETERASGEYTQFNKPYMKKGGKVKGISVCLWGLQVERKQKCINKYIKLSVPPQAESIERKNTFMQCSVNQSIKWRQYL